MSSLRCNPYLPPEKRAAEVSLLWISQTPGNAVSGLRQHNPGHEGFWYGTGSAWTGHFVSRVEHCQNGSGYHPGEVCLWQDNRTIWSQGGRYTGRYPNGYQRLGFWKCGPGRNYERRFSAELSPFPCSWAVFSASDPGRGTRRKKRPTGPCPYSDFQSISPDPETGLNWGLWGNVQGSAKRKGTVQVSPRGSLNQDYASSPGVGQGRRRGFLVLQIFTHAFR